ncbi:MAG: peptidoglycan-binding domain-containing protein [Chthoniobacterales bacterium]
MSKHLLILAAAAIPLWPGVARADESTRAVQEELRRRHLYYGNIDGRETPGLTEALQRYQERKGFRQTGVADPETLRSMGINDELARSSELPDMPVLRSDRALAPGELASAEKLNEGTTGGSLGTVPSEQEVRSYLRDYLDACQGPNVLAEIAYFAPQVAYFDRGGVTKTYIRNESVAYRQRWPERKYVLGEPIKIVPRGDKLQVTYRLNFAVGNSVLSQSASGSTENTMLLTRGSDQRLEIAAIQEERVRATPAETRATATRPRSRNRGRSTDATSQALRKVGRTMRKIFR